MTYTIDKAVKIILTQCENISHNDDLHNWQGIKKQYYNMKISETLN